MKKRIEVVGAVIVRDGQILCAQRGLHATLPGMWEFPGGKIEPDETAREALVREINEELLCEITVGEEINTAVHEYDFGIIALTTFFCELVNGTPLLTEHEAVVWLEPEELESLNWAPADVPAVKAIVQKLSK